MVWFRFIGLQLGRGYDFLAGVARNVVRAVKVDLKVHFHSRVAIAGVVLKRIRGMNCARRC